MSTDTYWLDKRDAEFVMRVLEKYSSTTKLNSERDAGIGPNDPAFEITVRRHEPNTTRGIDPRVKYPTLRSVLLAEEGALLKKGSNSGDTANITE